MSCIYRTPLPHAVSHLFSDEKTEKSFESLIPLRSSCLSTVSDMHLINLCLLLLGGVFLRANASPVELGLELGLGLGLHERELDERALSFTCVTCIGQCIGWVAGCVAACGPFEIFTPIACAVCSPLRDRHCAWKDLSLTDAVGGLELYRYLWRIAAMLSVRGEV